MASKRGIWSVTSTTTSIPFEEGSTLLCMESLENTPLQMHDHMHGTASWSTSRLDLILAACYICTLYREKTYQPNEILCG